MPKPARPTVEPPRAILGGLVAIHAGARPARRAEVQDLILRLEGDEAWATCLDVAIALPLLRKVLTSPGCLPLSHVLCTAALGAPVRGDAIGHWFGGPAPIDFDRAEHCNWGWPLVVAQRLEPPVPARGAQGLWPWQVEGLAA